MSTTTNTMPFGTFRGYAFDALPCWYLKWLVAQPWLRNPLKDGLLEEFVFGMDKETADSGEPKENAPNRQIVLELIAAGRRRLAARYHPDRSGGDAETMKAINIRAAFWKNA